MGSFDKDFVLLTFLLLFGIGTVVIGPGGVNWPRFRCGFVGGYGGGKFYYKKWCVFRLRCLLTRIIACTVLGVFVGARCIGP